MEVKSVKIPENDIVEYYGDAYAIILNAEVTDVSKNNNNNKNDLMFMPSTIGGTSPLSKTTKKINLESTLKSDNTRFLSPERQSLLSFLQRSIAIGMTVSDFFVEPLGFLALGEKNKSGRLHGEELTKFNTLIKVRAVISSFSAVSYLFYKINTQATGEPIEMPTLTFNKTTEALGWVIQRLSENVNGVEDKDFYNVIARLCADMLDRIELDAHTIMGEYDNVFSNVSYGIGNEDFHIHGFERFSGQKKASSVVQFKKPEEVIGNHIAKSQAMRLAKMLSSYDFETKKNPFVELGGFLFTFIGDGNPGTGKTTLIQMAAGLINNYAVAANYPFHFENFSIDQISEYQGKSAQNCRAFIDRVLNPNSLGFGTIDDIDQIAGKRDDSKSSGGQQEVTAVLMEAFAGSSTIVRGNCTFGMFSNYPEKVDDALRQRAGARWLVDGPQTENDYIDIFSLLIGKNHSIPVGNRKLFESQNLKTALSKSYEEYNEPSNNNLKTIIHDVEKQYGDINSLEKIGIYLYKIKEMEPRFTGRAIKNITDAIKYRSMDFDLPDEWFDNPEKFMYKSYAEKLDMVSQLRKPITIDMIIQEINRYAESELRYTDKSNEAEIDKMIRYQKNSVEAAKRLANETK